MMISDRLFSGLAVSSLLLSACSGQNSQFGGVASSVLSSTGLITHSQATTLIGAGGKLAKAASGFSEEQEHFLGRGVSAKLLGDYRAYNDQQLASYVSRVGSVVAAQSDRPYTFSGYHFQVLDSAQVNAMAAPGGFIFITRGLLKVLPDEDALAGVLAHEVAHVVLGHGVKAISQANVSEALLMLGQEAARSSANAAVSNLSLAFGNSINDITATLLTKGYGRRQEYAADELALELMQRAGYNPYALVTVMEMLQKTANDKSGWFATHPAPEDRKDNLLDEVDTKVALTAGQNSRARRFRAVVKPVA